MTKKKQREVVEKTADGFIELLLSYGKELDNRAYGPALARGYFSVAYVHSTRFKSADPWSKESEWRGVIIKKDKLHRFDLKLPRLDTIILEVIIGPQSEVPAQRAALEEVRAKGSYQFDIIESQCSR